VPQNETTNTAGECYFTIKAEASGNITIFIEGGYDPDNKYVIQAMNKQSMTVEVSKSSVNEGESFIVTVKDSSGTGIEGVLVTVSGIGLSDYTGSDGTVTFTAPEDVGANIQCQIYASKDGYYVEGNLPTITIIHLPQLIVTTDKATYNEGDKVTVTVSENGASVYLNDEFKGIAAGGTFTFTAPEVDKDTTYTITVEKTGFKSASTEITVKNKAGVPGFELVTLIAALGIALILLRRRR